MQRVLHAVRKQAFAGGCIPHCSKTGQLTFASVLLCALCGENTR